MQRVTIIIALFFFLISCDQEGIKSNTSLNDTVIEYRRNGNVKMLSKVDTFQQISDSVLRYSSLLFSNKDTSSQVFQFPTGTSQAHIYKNEEGEETKVTLKKQANIRVNGQPFIINKYFFDVLNTVDEEHFIYFHENLGILKQEGYTWNFLLELHSNNELKPEIIFGIQEGIRRHFPKERKHIPSDIEK